MTSAKKYNIRWGSLCGAACSIIVIGLASGFLGMHWLILLGLAWLTVGSISTMGEEEAEVDQIYSIEKQLTQLIQIEATLKNQYQQGNLSQDEFQEKMILISRKRKHLEDKFNDSVASMLDSGIHESVDPLALQIQHREQADQPSSSDDSEASAIEITEVKRGILNETRALEVKFHFRQTLCKALISSDEGKWRINSNGQSLYFFQFMNAMKESRQFLETFEKEARRHGHDWYDVVVKGKLYKQHNVEKDSRVNFPDECRQILIRFAKEDTTAGTDRTESQPISPLAGKAVVVQRVDHGEFTNHGKNEFGKGFPEYPRFIAVYWAVGDYRLRSEILTDLGEWETVSADPSQDCPRELLENPGRVIPFMIAELEQTKNKFLARIMLSEMRKKEQRHQWHQVIIDSVAGVFPRECYDLFEKE